MWAAPSDVYQYVGTRTQSTSHPCGEVERKGEDIVSGFSNLEQQDAVDRLRSNLIVHSRTIQINEITTKLGILSRPVSDVWHLI